MTVVKELEALCLDFKHAIRINSDITPYKIAVVVLILQFMKSKRYPSTLGVTYSAQARRKFCVLLLKLIQLPDMSYYELYKMLCTNRIGASQLTDFSNSMDDFVMFGIDNLVEFSETQFRMDKASSVSSGFGQYGIIGLYVRRIVVTVERMSYTELRTIHRSLISYFEKGSRHLNFDNKAETSTSKDVGALAMENSHSKWSIRQAELFISQQSSLLENNETEALSPIKLQNQMCGIVNDNPLLSQAHFLSYMNYLRLRDFFGSLDLLHRAFDRSPIFSLTPTGVKGFQYPSLNLAVFHCQLGQKAQSQACLRECSILSKQGADKQCLEFIDGWQSILENDQVNAKAITEESKLMFITSASLNIQFVVEVAGARGFNPATVFNTLAKSDELSGKSSISQMKINSTAERAAIWAFYGENELSSLYIQLLMKLNRSCMFAQMYNNDSVCQAHSMLALFLSTQGENDLAYAVLQSSAPRFSREPLSNSWLLSNSQVTQGVKSCTFCWREALESCHQQSILNGKIGMLQRASILISKGNFYAALRVLSSIRTTSNLETLRYIRELTLRSYCKLQGPSVHSQGIQFLEEASFIVSKKCFCCDSSIISMLFSHILLSSGIIRQSYLSLKRNMDAIFSNGSVYDQAKYSVLYVKSIVSTAHDKEGKLNRIQDCIPIINRAVSCFKKLQAHIKVKDTLAYVATVYHSIGETAERNKFAHMFRKYDQNFPTATEYFNAPF